LIINWLLVSVVVVVVEVVPVRIIANAVATPATANSTESTPMIVSRVHGDMQPPPAVRRRLQTMSYPSIIRRTKRKVDLFL
jgi:hypothetical protein